MAICFPEKPGPNTPDSERTVFTALAKLPDPWRVFHSVAWQSAAAGKSGDGEADFILLHPEHGLIVIEVKGGGVRVEGGQWYSFNPTGRHRIKDPFQQSTRSKHALVRYLRDRGQLPHLTAGHAVALPDLRSLDRLGPNAPSELALLETDLREPVQAIDRVVRHHELRGELTDDEVTTITALLAPTVVSRRLLADDLADLEARLIRLTEDQMRYLDFCRRSRRALITGGAGTGKTVLAVERARRLAVDGFRVLLTCFNRPLGNHLAGQFQGVGEVSAYSFHALCRWQIGQAGLPFPEDPPSEWWEGPIVELLMAAVERTEFEVDAVVVDEGQDFPPAWFTGLQTLMKDPDQGPMYVFADSHQSIYRSDWEPPFLADPFELTTNCRNTRPISTLVAGVFADTVDDRGIDGPEPTRTAVESDEGAIKAVRRVLHQWLNEGGLKATQVAVLTQRRELTDRLRSIELAGHRLTPLGGTGVTCETIHRFKGLEADAVVLILDALDTDRDRMLTYVGLSRAKSLLAVVGPQDVLSSLRD